ncbi:heavy-chain fibroin [Burkholderiales bacterium GJ-E10]|nr:heavy-chain fibroin [Burkholderiales bacterium GJ-E10]
MAGKHIARLPAALGAVAVGVMLTLMLASCGGGGSQSMSMSQGSGFFSLSAAQVAMVTQCTQRQDPALPTTLASNVAPLVVDAGPCAYYPSNNSAGPINAAQDVIYTTVTICPPQALPSSGACQTIDHVQVDTGSVGLRILASAMNSAVLQTLPAVSSGGLPVNDCYQYADGWTWGVLRTADVWVGGYNGTTSQGETAPAISVDIVGDPASGPISAAAQSTCSNGGAWASENSVATFGANGILGVMPAQHEFGTYYTCTANGCNAVGISPTQEANNPVYAISGTGDNNGIVVAMQSIGATGAPTATGSLTFGVGTQANNALSSTNPTTYVAAAMINGLPYTQGWITAAGSYRPLAPAAQPAAIFDTGTSFLSLYGSGMPVTGTQMWLTPTPSPVSVSAVVQGAIPNSGGNAGALTAQYAVSFPVANETTLPLQNWALNDLAANSTTQTIVWGAPFFFGRTIYMVDQGSSVLVGGSPANGPFYAY